MAVDEEFREFLIEVEEINRQIEDAGRIYTEYTETEKDEELSVEFSRLMKEIEKEISFLVNRSNNSITPQKQLHIQGLSDRTRRILRAFSQEERKRLKKKRERLEEQYLIAKPDATRTELDELTNKEKAEGLIEAAYTFGHKSKTEKLKDLEKRTDSIFHMLEELKGLEEIGENLLKIISDANQPLTTVSVSGQNAAQTTIETNRYIEQITKQKRRRRTLKIISVLLFFIIGLIAVGYIAKIFKIFRP